MTTVPPKPISFNLITQPWIPYTHHTGEIEEASLMDVLTHAHLIREIASESPPTTAAIHRLLIAIILRAFQVRNVRIWAKYWEQGVFPKAILQSYFEHYHDHFDLFHPQRPFMQAADERVKPKSLGAMILDVAAGNNGTLFSHHTDADEISLSPAQAARALITIQAFGLAGLTGLVEKFTSAPCVGGVIFLVEGENLFETLMLNSFYPNNHLPPPQPNDRPSWEVDNPLEERTIPHGYLDYLTWFNRRILLKAKVSNNEILVNKMTMGPGLRLDPSILDPMKAYRTVEKRGYIAQRFNEDRALWRDSAILFCIHDTNYRPPQALNAIAHLVSDGILKRHHTYQLIAMGMSSDQAKIEFFRYERLPLPLDYLMQPALNGQLQQELDRATHVSQQLWGAARTLALYLAAPNQDSGEGRSAQREDLDQLMGGWNIQRPYWSRLETEYFLFVSKLPTCPAEAIINWHSQLRKAATDSLDRIITMVEHGQRGYKAAVQAHQHLRNGLALVLPEQKPQAAHSGNKTPSPYSVAQITQSVATYQGKSGDSYA